VTAVKRCSARGRSESLAIEDSKNLIRFIESYA
jgi:hypothetical protein